MPVELSTNAGTWCPTGAFWNGLRQRRKGELWHMRTIMGNLRRELSDDAENPTYIITESRVGYRMPKRGDRTDGVDCLTTTTV